MSVTSLRSRLARVRALGALGALFTYAPYMAIKVHPMRPGSGEWTTVTGVMMGTFTKPMPTGNWTFIEPTAKRVAQPMPTIGQ